MGVFHSVFDHFFQIWNLRNYLKGELLLKVQLSVKKVGLFGIEGLLGMFFCVPKYESSLETWSIGCKEFHILLIVISSALLLGH